MVETILINQNCLNKKRTLMIMINFVWALAPLLSF